MGVTKEVFCGVFRGDMGLVFLLGEETADLEGVLGMGISSSEVGVNRVSAVDWRMVRHTGDGTASTQLKRSN
jgi:hypothetical protein